MEEGIEDTTTRMPSTKSLAILLCALSLIALGVYFAVGIDSTETVSDTSDQEIGTVDATPEQPSQVSGDAYTASDQDAGMKVIVRDLRIEGTSWLVVHELRADGTRGNALGAGLFSEGNAAFGEVPLLRGTEAGKRYAVLVYGDDGDRQFDLKKDIVKKNAAGEVISVSFFALSVE